MTLALRPQLKRSFCSQKWLFTLLLSLLIALTSHLPIAAVKIAFQSSRDFGEFAFKYNICLLYTSPSPRDRQKSRMPSSA